MFLDTLTAERSVILTHLRSALDDKRGRPRVAADEQSHHLRGAWCTGPMPRLDPSLMPRWPPEPPVWFETVDTHWGVRWTAWVHSTLTDAATPPWKPGQVAVYEFPEPLFSGVLAPSWGIAAPGRLGLQTYAAHVVPTFAERLYVETMARGFAMETARLGIDWHEWKRYQESITW